MSETKTKQTDEQFKTTLIEGFHLSRTFDDGLARIRDVELGERLEYSQTRHVRRLIRSMIASGKLKDVAHRTAAVRSGFGPNQAEVEYWLTRAQALKVIMRAETAVADQLSDEIIAVFEAYLDGRMRPTSAADRTAAPVLDDATLAALIDRMGAHIAKRVDARIEERLEGQQLKFSLAADRIASYTPVHGVISTRTYNELCAISARLAEIEGEIAFLSGKQPDKERAVRSARSRIIGAIKRIAHYGYAPGEKLINMKAIHEYEVFAMLRDREFRGLERLEQLKLARQTKIDFKRANDN